MGKTAQDSNPGSASVLIAELWPPGRSQSLHFLCYHLLSVSHVYVHDIYTTSLYRQISFVFISSTFRICLPQ